MQSLSQKGLALTAGLAVLLVLAAAVGCAAGSAEQGTPTSTPASRQAVLVNLTEELIAPRFQAVATEMDALRIALDDLCVAPGPASLSVARTAWRDARALDAFAGDVVRAGDGAALALAGGLVAG